MAQISDWERYQAWLEKDRLEKEEKLRLQKEKKRQRDIKMYASNPQLSAELLFTAYDQIADLKKIIIQMQEMLISKGVIDNSIIRPVLDEEVDE